MVNVLRLQPIWLPLIAAIGVFLMPCAGALAASQSEWQECTGNVAKNPDLACGKLLARTCPQLSAAEAAAYDAPFPDARYKAGVRRFPPLVPEKYDDPGASISRKARDWLHSSWKGESFMAIGAKDPVLGLPVMNELRKSIRNCPPPLILAEGGHFLQEWGEEVARAALEHWKRP